MRRRSEQESAGAAQRFARALCRDESRRSVVCGAEESAVELQRRAPVLCREDCRRSAKKQKVWAGRCFVPEGQCITLATFV